MKIHQSVPITLLAYARVQHLAKFNAEAVGTPQAGLLDASLRELIRTANEARVDGEAEYREYLRYCAASEEDGLITMF